MAGFITTGSTVGPASLGARDPILDQPGRERSSIADRMWVAPSAPCRPEMPAVQPRCHHRNDPRDRPDSLCIFPTSAPLSPGRLDMPGTMGGGSGGATTGGVSGRTLAGTDAASAAMARGVAVGRISPLGPVRSPPRAQDTPLRPCSPRRRPAFSARGRPSRSHPARIGVAPSPAIPAFPASPAA